MGTIPVRIMKTIEVDEVIYYGHIYVKGPHIPTWYRLKTMCCYVIRYVPLERKEIDMNAIFQKSFLFA